MADGYVYRGGLLERLMQEVKERPVLLWGPPGFGKTLLLREVARHRDWPYREEWSEESGVYDLKRPPPEWRPGQVLALRRKPLGAAEAALFGPEALALGVEEAREMARRLGVGKPWRKVWSRLGGWPLLLRRAYEQGARHPHEEPLRTWIEAFLARLTPDLREGLELLRLAPSEPAARRALGGEVLATLLERGIANPREGRLRLLPALHHFLEATAPLPPLEQAEPLLRAEARLGDPEAALQGFLRYGSPRASDVFVIAAKRWNREGQPEKTVRYWEQLQAIEERPEVCLAVAEAEYLGGRLQHALGLYEHAVSVREDRAKKVEALLGLGTVRVRLGRYEEAVEALQRAREWAEGDQVRRVEASLGGALIRLGRYAEAAEVLRGRSRGEAAADRQVEARALHNLGIALHHMGLTAEAAKAYRASLRLRANAEPRARANTLLSLGEALHLAGRWEEAYRALEEAVAEAEASGDYRAMGYSRLNQGDLFVAAHWLDRAEASYRASLEHLEPSGDRYGMGLVEFGLGRAYAARGRPSEAAWRYRRALELLERGGSPAELASVWVHQARLDPSGAPALLARAREAALQVGARRIELRARLDLLALRAPEISAEELEAAAAELVELEATPLLLAPEYAPLWVAAAAAGEAGALVHERLLHGWGAVRVFSLGTMRFVREAPVEFFSRKEPWVLFALWLEGPQGADALAERLFPEAKNARKRVQIAVHHVREALGPLWIRFLEGRYHARPLPGTWWDHALLRAVAAGCERVPDWAPGACERAVETLRRGPFLPGSPLQAAAG